MIDKKRTFHKTKQSLIMKILIELPQLDKEQLQQKNLHLISYIFIVPIYMHFYIYTYNRHHTGRCVICKSERILSATYFVGGGVHELGINLDRLQDR